MAAFCLFFPPTPHPTPLPLWLSSETWRKGKRKQKNDLAMADIFISYIPAAFISCIPSHLIQSSADHQILTLPQIRLAELSGCCFALALDFLASLFFIWRLSPPSTWQEWVCPLVSAGRLSILCFFETAEVLRGDDFSSLLFSICGT